MAEDGPSKVRLVRCPKCEKLLSELPSYSVYRCGGCDALLRAKKKVTVNGGLLEKLEKDRGEDGFERLESLSEKEDGGRDLRIAFEVEREKRNGVLLDRRKERVFKERTFNLVGNYKEISIDRSNRIVEEQIMDYQRGGEKEIGYNDKYKVPLNHPIRNFVGQDDIEMSMNRSESVNSNREKDIGRISAQFKGSTGSLRSKPMVENWGLNRDGLGGPRGGNLTMGDHPSKFSNFVAYPDEGPSNYNHMKSSYYVHGQLLKNFDDPDGPKSFAHLDQDRAELLRKLDELKEQIYRSSSVAEKQRETAAVDFKVAPSFYNHDCVPYNVPMRPLAPDKHVSRPNNFRQNGYEHVVSTSKDMDMQNFYFPPKHHANEFPVYKGPMHLQMPRLDSHQSPGHYLQQPLHDYYLRTDVDFDREQLASYPHGTLYHAPACACSHCYNKKWHVPSKVPASAFGRKHFVEESTGSSFKHQVNPIKSGSQNPTPQVNHSALRSRDPQSHVRWPTEIDSDMDDFRHRRPRRVMVARGNGRICHPFTGGAPFIACCSCFELLKLPKKLKSREKNQQKLRCGACSILFLVEIRNKKLVISIPVENRQILTKANNGSCEVSKEVLLSPEGDFNAEGKNCSVDFDNLSYNFQSADFQENTLQQDQRLNWNESGTRRGLTSLSSEEEEITDSMIVQRDVSDFPELPRKDNASPTYPRSLFMEHTEDISSNRKINRNGEGNKSNRTDNEKVILDKSTCQQNIVNDVASETEVEDSFNEFPNTTTSYDSLEVSKEDLQPRINKGSESFLVGLLKKSFRDFSRSYQQSENKKPNVFVNGHPIPDSMVKRAEKLAGPIHPGDYWYDTQAGFWGVIGQPCLGIIPPCIKEFNYPIPENCSSGNTGIFVNGRELHKKDLDLLVSRGLPSTKEKFYVIEISGRVLEKDTGKELKSLGKLAPTVQKMKRGFGMKVPRKPV